MTLRGCHTEVLSLFYWKGFNKNSRLTNYRTEIRFRNKRGMVNEGWGGVGVGKTNNALGNKEMKLFVSVAVKEINTYVSHPSVYCCNV